MTSDRARMSHDPTRDYRAVVLQQGRVALEADTNEARRIAEDARREEIIDIVGPMGTCDDGYQVSATGDGFIVGAGSYYLGGWRVTLATPIALGKGPDELDHAPPQYGQGPHAIALLLTEQDVGAVEDRALREVALGGPDTAQRTRLMQRAIAVAVDADDCPGAAQGVAKAIAAEGAAYDPATGAILPITRLQVSFVASPAPPDPCDPPASGGYLGADNQLIRVAVTHFDAATGTGRLVWGYDNASTLYRAATSDGTVLTLEGEPVDSDHAPRLGQAVEVLRTRALFAHGDVIAADAGVVTNVAQPYDPDLRRVRIATTLPVGERGDATHPLFVRLWESELPFARGVAVEIGLTGLAVTLTLDAMPGPIVARPFWTFAARPSTPVIVYPRRYLDAPQPPEGPRQWLAPLAVGLVARPKFDVIDDCRDFFVPLTQIAPGCCGILIDADSDGERDRIQRALDRLRGTRGTVTLRPGHYRLRAPILLDASHKGLTLEGCGEGVFLEAADADDPAFARGLIVLDDVNEVTLRWLQVQMPLTPLATAGEKAFGTAADRIGTYFGSVGIGATGCAQLTIEDCQFRYRLRDRAAVFAVGLLARGECWGMRLRRNRFLHDVDYAQTPEAPRLLYGILLLPAIGVGSTRPTVEALSRARIDALIDDAEIVDNQFVGLGFAVMMFARFGTVRIDANRVQGCVAGMYLLEAALTATLQTMRGSGTMLPMEALAGAMAFTAHITPTAPGPAVVARDMQRVERAAATRSRAYRSTIGAVDIAIDRGDDRTASAFERIAAAIATRHDGLDPVLHVQGNAFDVFGTTDPKGPDGGVGASAFAIVFEQRDERAIADVLVTGNRFADRCNPAVAIVLPQRLVFGSNIVIGSGGDEIGALLIMTDPKQAVLEVMGNVVDRYVRIIPPERPVQPSQDWSFVNRVF